MYLERVKTLQKSEIEQIVKLHQKILNESVLNKFGYSFLFIIYKSIPENPQNIVLVLRDKKKIVGFTVATLDSSNFYKKIVNNNFLLLSLAIIKTIILNPLLLYQVMSWILNKSSSKKYPAELQFIALDSNYQGKGLGTKMVKELVKLFKSSNINYFKVGTKKNNLLSNKFYRKLGYKYLFSEKILGDDFNYYLSAKT
jgi:ribosomal protein S18 acetylase RimI-like enzyme